MPHREVGVESEQDALSASAVRSGDLHADHRIGERAVGIRSAADGELRLELGDLQLVAAADDRGVGGRLHGDRAGLAAQAHPEFTVARRRHGPGQRPVQEARLHVADRRALALQERLVRHLAALAQAELHGRRPAGRRFPFLGEMRPELGDRQLVGLSAEGDLARQVHGPRLPQPHVEAGGLPFARNGHVLAVGEEEIRTVALADAHGAFVAEPARDARADQDDHDRGVHQHEAELARPVGPALEEQEHEADAKQGQHGLEPPGVIEEGIGRIASDGVRHEAQSPRFGEGAERRGAGSHRHQERAELQRRQECDDRVLVEASHGDHPGLRTTPAARGSAASATRPGRTVPAKYSGRPGLPPKNPTRSPGVGVLRLITPPNSGSDRAAVPAAPHPANPARRGAFPQTGRSCRPVCGRHVTPAL